MPYCAQCGKEVAAAARFCGSCGAAQPSAGASAASPGAPGLSDRNASLLCYVPFIGWIGALYILATDRFRALRDIRFHAFQGLYLFVFWLVIDFISDNFGGRGRYFFEPVKLAIVVGWIYMLVQTANNRMVRLPVLGEWAERSVDEQK